MTRDHLLDILKRAPSTEGSKSSFRFGEDHQASFYLGLPGQAMTIASVTAVELHDTVVEIRAKEMGSVFTTYESIVAFSIRPPKDASRKTAGFV